MSHIFAVAHSRFTVAAEIVEMRFFAGLTVEEIAEVLEISPATVKREWATAKMWLKRQMRGLST